MLTRIKILQKIIQKPLLIKKVENIFYLTGEKVITGFLLVTPKTAMYLGDGLECVPGIKNDNLKGLNTLLRAGTLVEYEDSLTVRDLNLLKKNSPKLKFIHTNGYIEKLRLVKTSAELNFIRDAVKLTHEVFFEVKDALKKDAWTEKQLARFIRYTGIGLGAEDVSFDPIVAAGKNSSMPHHKPGDNVIKIGEPVVIDFGFKIGGYCSDFTRTVFLKKVPKEFLELYTHTLSAYEHAFSEVKSGMNGKTVDALARDLLHKQKLSKFFIHSLGHGTGLEVHEHPGVGPYSESSLEEGMVFSIEPGVYKKGIGGIRIEDLVYLEKGKAKQFVESSRKLQDMIIK